MKSLLAPIRFTRTKRCRHTIGVIFHWGPFSSYGKMIPLTLLAFEKMFYGCATRSAVLVSPSAACLCFRCWNKLVMLLPLVAADFRQTLQQVVVCLRLDIAKPNHFQTTEESALFGNKLSFISTCAAMLIFYLSVAMNYRSSGKLWQFHTVITLKW